MKLRVGIIGLGDPWEKRYRRALRALQDRFEVRAIYSPVGLLADKAARVVKAKSCGGFRQLIRRKDIDAVLYLAQDWLGHLPVVAACDEGKAVYSAARLDVDLAGAVELQRRIDDSGIAFMAEFVRRHAPATVRLKELIATRLGQPKLLFCHHRSRPSGKHSGTKRKRWTSSPIHRQTELVDWCCYVVGREPESVTGIGHHVSGTDEREDYSLLSLDFSSDAKIGTGPVAQISSGSYLKPGWPEAISFRSPAQLQVCCERGVAFLDLPATVVWFDKAGRHLESLDSERPVGEQLLMQFHRAVTSLVRKRGDFLEACRAQQIVLTGRQSALEGRRISLTQ